MGTKLGTAGSLMLRGPPGQAALLAHTGICACRGAFHWRPSHPESSPWNRNDETEFLVLQRGKLQMSAIGSVNRTIFDSKHRIIGSHPDYKPSDFMFARSQSIAFRETPWESRLRPLKPWSELAAIGVLAATAAVVSVTLL
jgi:hypothetical protein